ncbi:MAG: S8 family serine peptidase [Actinobacteria bacterium]|nr:S8 family serine peptidase [Actinomycetota bacterium]
MTANKPIRLMVLGIACVALLVATMPAEARSQTQRSRLHTLPLASGSVDPAVDLVERDPRGLDLVLVQWDRFGDSRAVDDIASTGTALVQPLAPVSYLVWADADQTQAIRALAGIRWAGVLPSPLRVADNVDASTELLRVTLIGDAGRLGARRGHVVERHFTDLAGSVVVLPGGATLARAIARNPEVYSVAEAVTHPQLRDERTATIVARGTEDPLVPDHRGFLAEHGADGTGVIVSHVDGGVDFNHPELSDRIADCIDYETSFQGTRCQAGNTDDPIGHGTHTLGILMGTGSTELGDADGFDYGLGVAPGAEAVVQNAIGLGVPYFPDGYTSVYRDAWARGAIVSQNSWGPAGDPQGYDADTREFDAMVRDLEPDTPGDQGIGLVFSIMNGSGGESTQGSPDEGKNLIGVGGTIGRGGSPDDLCTCTAHGPALDGRLLPTLVAPGQNVMSTRATQGTLCGLPRIAGASSDVSPLHGSCTGTSMASPHVTGGYAVFVDWYRQHIAEATPSPALVKAAFVNGADDLAGANDADGETMTHIPNNKQGWGRLNLENVLGAWTAGVVHVDQSVVLDASGASHALRVEPIDPSEPMKVSLAWTDAVGPGLGGDAPAWVNDLDLRVLGPDGTTWLGNAFESGMSVTGGSADRMNNIENVFLTAPSGSYDVTIEAANIIGDGVPNSGDDTDQDFALVISNARPAA